MDKLENQAHITNFILESSAELTTISQDNPVLFNALIDAFEIMSNEFGTGETKMEKVEEVKVVEKIEIPEKKKRGTKKKLTKEQINELDGKDLFDAVMNIPPKIRDWIDKMSEKGSRIASQEKPIRVAITKYVDTQTSPNSVVYDIVEVSTGNVEWKDQRFDRDKFMLFVVNEINFFVDNDGNKIKVGDKSALEKAPEQEQVIPQQPPSGYSDFNISNGMGGYEIIYVPITFRPTISISEYDLISVGNLILDTSNNPNIYRITDVGSVFFDVEFVDENFDIQDAPFNKKDFLSAVKDNKYLLVRDSGTTKMGLRIFDSFEINITKSTAKKPKKQASPEEIEALELELETAMLLAEVGDADAIKDVEKIKKKLSKLKV